MKRTALIIYCPNANPKRPLTGPVADEVNYRDFLTSNAGGNWKGGEILSLEDPTSDEVMDGVKVFHQGSDYTFTIFTGHGFIDKDDGLQYVELFDLCIPILDLNSHADRQTLIVDACRSLYKPAPGEIMKSFSKIYESYVGITDSTRKLYEDAILNADEGWTILNAASRNQSARDTNNGAAYLLSLLKAAETWEKTNKIDHILTLEDAHEFAKEYVGRNFPTTQKPSIEGDKRWTHFPFSVKFTSLH